MKNLPLGIAAALIAALTGQTEAGPPVYQGQAAHVVPVPPPPNLNPVVYDSGRNLSGVCYGPLGIRYQVRTDREVAHASAYDPDRPYADPGSLRYVDRWVSDACGNSYRERGYAWTSNGVPHSDMNISQRYRTSRFGSRVDDTHVAKTAGQPDGE